MRHGGGAEVAVEEGRAEASAQGGGLAEGEAGHDQLGIAGRAGLDLAGLAARRLARIERQIVGDDAAIADAEQDGERLRGQRIDLAIGVERLGEARPGGAILVGAGGAVDQAADQAELGEEAGGLVAQPLAAPDVELAGGVGGRRLGEGEDGEENVPAPGGFRPI